MAEKSGRSPRKNHWLIHCVLILICLGMMFPIVIAIIESFKLPQDIQRNPPTLLPCDTPTQAFNLGACRWSINGYQRVLSIEPDAKSPFGFDIKGTLISVYLGNTLLYAVSASILVVLLAAASGYAFSRFNFRGKRAMMTAIIAITGVPLLTNLLGLYQMGVVIRKSGFPYDDRAFLIIVYVGMFLPLSVWIAKGFFDAIPRDLDDAALIDGCSRMGALFRVIMPLTVPGLVAIFLLTFVNVWNEFLAGYLLVSQNQYKPVMYGLYNFLGENLINLQVIGAACILISLPVIVLFLFFRRSFFEAMVEGAIKG
ncbi:MAG TPA: carbohydrate ABC transporter permease [Anaerolineales bacterium]|nr:carbohydrate ABC transporter permease [Anaerolineales bacterium]